jgi:outer membrane protein
MKRFAPLGFTLLLMLPLAAVSAQEVWSLERCINHALENNITVKQANASVSTTQLAELQAKASRYPNVSAGVNAGKQYGRTIDPTTNQFRNQDIGFNSMSLNAGMNVFAGGQIHHQVKQAQFDTKAAKADAENTANTLALNIASAYLSILQAEEQLNNARNRVALSRQQLANTNKLIDAGNTPVGERFTIEAQLARDEQAEITALNSLELGFLNLKQLLQLEPDYPMSIERPAVQISTLVDPESFTLAEIYQQALSTQPNVEAADYRVQSADEGISLARSAYYPTVSLFAALNSNYSTQFRTPTFTGNVTRDEFPTIVNINDMDVPVYFYSPEIIINDVGYFDQLDQNFGQSFGVSVNIPIYSNHRNKLSVERARLNKLTSEMQNTQVRQQLKNDIQTAIANARSAKRQLAAAEKTLEAQTNAYANTEKRYSIGAANTFEMTTAKNNLDIAQNDLTVAKYDYLFRLKIIDFYLGKPITLD